MLRRWQALKARISLPYQQVILTSSHFQNGYVYSWGANSYGQLGNNTTSNVTSLSGVTQVVGQSGENYLYDIVKIVQTEAVQL